MFKIITILIHIINLLTKVYMVFNEKRTIEIEADGK